VQRLERNWPYLLGIAVFAVALWAQSSALVGVFYDDGIYTVLAKSLAEGHGYRYIHLPGSPPGVHYPFLYPAVLAVLWKIWPAFPANVALFQLFDASALGVAAWLIARQAVQWNAPPLVKYLFIPAGFFAFPLLTIVGVRFSEPLFLALAAGAVSMVDQEKDSPRQAIAAGLLAGLATLARSVGLAVVAGIVIGLWVRGGRRGAVLALVTALAVVSPWIVWVASHAHEVDPRIAANYGSYATEARQAGIAGMLAGLDLRALAAPGRLAFGVGAAWVRYPVLLLLLGALVFGAVTLFRRAPAFVSMLFIYVAIVTLWPYAPDRFMWVILPWMAALVGMGMSVGWSRHRAGKVLSAALGVALCVGYVPREISALRHRTFAATAQGISLPNRMLAPAIDAGLPREAVIAAEGEALIYLYTGRQAVQNALFSWKGRDTEPRPLEEIRGYFCDAGVTHIAISGPASDGAPVVAALAAKDSASIQRLFTVTDGPALYRFQCRA
jgi:hypothetical protein